MTSNDAPVPAAGSAGRRRVLGRGPGAGPAPAAPPGTPPEGEPAGESPDEFVQEPEYGLETAEPRVPSEAGPSTGPTPRPDPEPFVAPEPRPVPDGPEAGAAPEISVTPGVSAGQGTAAGPQSPAGTVLPVGPEAGIAVEAGTPTGAGAGSGSESGAESGSEAESEPAVRSDDGPEAGDGVFKVRLANFEGPFDLLLQLISKHKMDVTEVALSRVTDEFMAHIRAMGPDWDLDQTTEFLVVAATLLDLKAARLLPAAEVEDEADLALLEARDLLFARLLQYRAYKRIADIFNARLDEEGRRYPRTVGLEPHHAELLPEVVISIGAEGFARLAVKAMQPRPKPQVYVDHIHAPLVSVREQAEIVVALLRERGEANFRDLVADTADTLTVVARFLALLELYREKAVSLDQEEALGDLVVRWTGGDSAEDPRVTDEFDRPPETAKEDAKKEKA
ncbi:segregation/condensation protein A [Streptomyces sp. NPDC059466]|uniref:segregation and condensation protein A n=1 Tax=unclassified Streptomyces TaxID=2593676 RepID=UPI00368F87FF